jgi:hypothetical protein
MSSSAGRRLPRDPDEDVETRVYVRSAPMAWERRMVLQIMRDLGPIARAEPPPRRLGTPRLPPPASSSRIRTSAAPPAPRPNVFLTPRTPTDPQPLWVTSRDEETRSLETLVRDRNRKRRPRQSVMPWVLFVMAFGIAFGVGEDRALRQQLASDIRATTERAIAALHSVHR